MNIKFLEPGEDPTQHDNPHPRTKWGALWFVGIALLGIGLCLALAIPQALKAREEKEKTDQFTIGTGGSDTANEDPTDSPSTLPTVTITGSPPPVVVTALVDHTIQVTVPVTQIVEVPVPVTVVSPGEQISVAREVTRIVEVNQPIAVPVTVEVPVAVQVTQLVPIEVTRIVMVTAAPTGSTSPTVTVTATASPSPSPTATATPTLAVNTSTPTQNAPETPTGSVTVEN